ncbi:MAG: ABC transporter substrate-binding protein [Clostridia bacterium]|nr:ABC transporter substrate-binding protein [Clostridia bacterium]
MKRLISLLLMLLLLAGCSAGSGEQETETIDVVLDWYPNAVHAFLYQAIDKGYFEEEGLTVNILFPAGNSDPLSMPAAGRADIGFYYEEDIIIAKANEDVPVKVLGTVVQEPLAVIASLREKGITTPADLIGKTIGHTGIPFNEVAIAELLASVGATLDDVTLVDVGFDLMSAMTTGNVDATYGCFLNHELPALEHEGFAMDSIRVTDHGVPSHYALVLVTGEEMLAQNEDKYRRFLRACQKGFLEMKNDPEGSLDLMMESQNAENFPLTREVEKVSFDILLPMMEKDGAPFLSQDAAVWQENIDWLREKGMIETTFSPEEILVDLLS